MVPSMQVVSLILQSLSWCFMLIMIGVETKIYICEFRWFVRFGVIYNIVGDAVLFNLILTVKDFYNRFLSLCFTWIGSILVKSWYGYICSNFHIWSLVVDMATYHVQDGLTILSNSCRSVLYLYISEIVAQVCLVFSVLILIIG